MPPVPKFEPAPTGTKLAKVQETRAAELCPCGQRWSVDCKNPGAAGCLKA